MMRLLTLKNTQSSSLMACLLLMTLSFSAQAATPFTTNANFSVGSDGSANYSIPIQVPLGTAGMAPTLSLNYNSNGGNGILGMGWGLDGLSQISRCSTTIIIDGVINGVNYNGNDKFCIDGKRMVRTSAAAYGADQTEYRTTEANFAKIVSYGVAGTGPAYFKVWTKAGQIIEYGNSADSRIEAAGSSTARTWGVNKISDTKGNFMTVTYTEDNPNGEAYVSRVDYTGNVTTGQPTYAAIVFVYESKPDVSVGYHAGSVIKSTKRMTRMQTYTIGANLVKDYRLTYEQGTATQRSRLKTLTECDPVGVCLQPTIMTWQSETIGWGPAQSQAIGTGSGTLGAWFIDVNGDGKDDFVTKNADGIIYWNLSTGTGWGPAQSQAGLNGAGAYISTFADINGDGLSDYVAKNKDFNIYWNLANGTNWNGSQSQAIGTGSGTIGGWFEDVNGDGKDDFVTKNSDGIIYWNLSTGTGWGPAQSQAGLNGAGAYISTFADINGDGLSDYVAKNKDFNIYWNLANGTNWNGSQSQAIGTGSGTIGSWFVDINGDRKDDFVTKNNDGNIYWNLSTGTGWGPAQSQTGLNGAGAARWLVDINGDGLSDYVAKNNDGYIYWNLSTGTGWGPNQSQVGMNYLGVYGRWLADINGDGFPDYIAKNNDGNIYWNLSISTPGYLNSLTSGLGSTTNITYTPITNSGVYAKDTSATVGNLYCPVEAGVYPVNDIQEPQYVVSTATISDGNSGVLTNNYSYAGAKVHLTGRGSLGFRIQNVYQTEANIVTSTYFRQDYPYVGLPCQVAKYKYDTDANGAASNYVLINYNALTYANSPLTTGTAISQFPYLSQSTENSYELGGTLINSTTTTNQYDSFGNATQISVNSGDGYIKTTTNVYHNDTTNWFLGRLLKSTVTSTTP